MGRESEPLAGARVTVRTPTAPDRWSPGQRLQDVPRNAGGFVKRSKCASGYSFRPHPPGCLTLCPRTDV